MKIALMVHSLLGVNGISKHALHVARELNALGHLVTVWTLEYDRENCYPELATGLDIRGLREPRRGGAITVQAPAGKRMAIFLMRLWRAYSDQQFLARAMPAGYDVAHPHGNEISWAAADYKSRHGTPVVWLCNDFWPMASHRGDRASSVQSRVKRLAKEGLCLPFERHDRASVRTIDRIVVLSEHVKSQMASHYAVNPVVMRPGVDAARFLRGDGAWIRKRHGIGDRAYLLLSLCELMPRRRIEDVIRGLRRLVDEGFDAHYLVVGRTTHTPEYTEYLRQEVSACHLEDRVRFTGLVPEQDLPDYFHACDAFVWASDENQSWGLAGMEAMAAGRPVVVSRANGLGEVLEDGETALLVQPKSPEAIAAAIRRLIADPPLANRIAARGRRLVLEGYSWPAHAEELVALFHEAAGSGPVATAKRGARRAQG